MIFCLSGGRILCKAKNLPTLKSNNCFERNLYRDNFREGPKKKRFYWEKLIPIFEPTYPPQGLCEKRVKFRSKKAIFGGICFFWAGSNTSHPTNPYLGKLFWDLPLIQNTSQTINLSSGCCFELTHSTGLVFWQNMLSYISPSIDLSEHTHIPDHRLVYLCFGPEHFQPTLPNMFLLYCVASVRSWWETADVRETNIRDLHHFHHEKTFTKKKNHHGRCERFWRRIWKGNIRYSGKPVDWVLWCALTLTI